jgi:chromosome segregation ATPase
LETSRLKDAERELQGELRLFADHNHRPAIKDESKLPNQATCREVECIGLTVDLGYVEDEMVARVLSHAAGHYMNTVICKDDASAQSLFKKNIRCWSLTRMKTFSGSNGQHKKTDTSKAELPLPQINHEGNPRYLVNIIQLDPEHEYLRDTLFFAIFDRTLLFDTAESALSYQKKMIDSKQRPPTIVTMEGDKFSPDGMLNPSAKMPRKLPFVFGELPLVRNNSARSFEGQLATLKRLLVLVEQRDVADSKFRQLQDEYDEINRARSEISSIQKQLAELGA